MNERSEWKEQTDRSHEAFGPIRRGFPSVDSAASAVRIASGVVGVGPRSKRIRTERSE